MISDYDIYYIRGPVISPHEIKFAYGAIFLKPEE